MNKFLLKRELGICNERREIIDEIKRSIRHLDLSVYKQIINYNKGPINHLDIDVAENRYLLSVSGDGIIQIYDLFENLLNNKKNNEIKTEFQPILKINRKSNNNNNNNINNNNNSEGILLKGISSVQWYPIDTGIFFIGGVNGNVEVWDTNLGQVSQTFYLENCVNSISYSQVNCTNLLIAAATTDPKVRLCDMRTNSSVHCLTGHRESVLSIKWSPFSPNLIATASKDKTIRLWDIRRGDTFLFALDQYNGNGSGGSGIGGGNDDVGNDIGGGNKNDLKQSKRYRQKLHKPKSLQTSSSSIIEKRNMGGYSGGSANLTLKKEVPTAHNGTITSIAWTPDGNYLVSTGADSKIRLWDIQKGGANTMINYPNAHNVHKIPNQICLSTNGQYLFHPNGRAIHVYETATGNLVRQLKGHFEKVNCCVFNHCDQSLISGSNDRLTLYWDNSNDDQIDDQQFLNEEKQKNQNNNHDDGDNNNFQVTTTSTNTTTKTSTTISPPTTLEDVDNWSDDE
ncbi:hypothetical protein ACTFIY_003898 [Dictyostelium cf. discoideum]